VRGRRVGRIVRIVGGAVVAGLLISGVASASPKGGSSIPQGIWTGKTSQGLKLSFAVLQSKHGLVMEPSELDANLVCSGTGSEIGLGIGFIGFYVKIHSDGTFRFHQYDEFFGVVDFRGTLGDTSGSGSELSAMPGLTKDLGAEICTSGAVTWQAHPPKGGAPAGTRTRFQYRVVFTKDRQGHVSETITRS